MSGAEGAGVERAGAHAAPGRADDDCRATLAAMGGLRARGAGANVRRGVGGGGERADERFGLARREQGAGVVRLFRGVRGLGRIVGCRSDLRRALIFRFLAGGEEKGRGEQRGKRDNGPGAIDHHDSGPHVE